MTRATPSVPSTALGLPIPDAAGTHPVYPVMPARRRGAGIAAVLGAHLVLGWLMLTSSPSLRHAQSPSRSVPDIQWLFPQRAVPAPTVAEATPRPAAPKPRSRQPARRRPASAEVQPAVPVVPASEAVAPTPEPAAPAEEALRVPLDPARLVRDLKLSSMASGLDGKEKDAAARTLEAKLAQGFERAHATGDAGWLKSAGMKEISIPEANGTRVYQMRSLLGTFCVYVRNDGRPPVTGTCPRGTT